MFNQQDLHQIGDTAVVLLGGSFGSEFYARRDAQRQNSGFSSNRPGHRDSIAI
jgi:hypothetical protein